LKSPKKPGKFFIFVSHSRCFAYLFVENKTILRRFRLKSEPENKKLIAAGLSCPLNDYRLCHFINKSTNISFKRKSKPLLIGSKDKETVYVNQYLYEDELKKLRIHLIKNKQENKWLMPSLKKLDYFLLMETDEDHPVNCQNYFDILKNIPHIWYIFALPSRNLNNLQKLTRL